MLFRSGAFIELAYRSAMTALHIIGINLQLRLGIHMRFVEGRENEDEKEYILLPPSTEGLIEVDDTLYFIKAVGYLCQLGRE